MKFIQHVTPEADWPELGVQLDGTTIRLDHVETLLPPGDERASVYFVHAQGHKVWPWKESGYYIDDRGEPMAAAFDVVPMRRDELLALGLTDDALWSEHRAYFRTAPEEPPKDRDPSEAQVSRRKVYNAVMGVWYERPAAI